ncbi:hypothetical protein CRG98_005939 [Punica granatum]|uniref:Uncharacterized protein n=1 Tax=Punica granatum TaxID=22663 RepID=A0A2I0KYZ9_PUNGR|nr:hypothetical protein CRG98_005939 [Punica granatum]
MCAISHGLGVSTFPWGRVTDMCEKESPLRVYDPRVKAGELLESRGKHTPSMLRHMVLRNPKFRIRGFCYVWAYIPHAL